MSRLKELFHRWGPAVLMMALIFAFSSRPSTSLPNFSWADSFIKKGGHMLGYGLLALGFRRGLGSKKGALPAAWLMTIAYAITDEIHQSLVPGRHPSFWDVILFDGLGAMLALLIVTHYSRRNPSISGRSLPPVE